VGFEFNPANTIPVETQLTVPLLVIKGQVVAFSSLGININLCGPAKKTTSMTIYMDILPVRDEFLIKTGNRISIQ
jgi:hypothetical protein